MQRRIFLAFVSISLLAVSGAGWGQTADQLLKEADKGDAKAVAALLDKGLDPNTVNNEGFTLLMIGALQGHEDMMRVVLDRKADVDRRTKNGDTAIKLACLKGHLGVVRLLVARGAQISESGSGWQPIHYAAFEGHAEIVRYLLEKGAEKDALAPNGYSPLLLAMRNDHMDAARELLYADADVRLKGARGETALSLAKKANDEKLVELIKRAGAVE